MLQTKERITGGFHTTEQAARNEAICMFNGLDADIQAVLPQEVRPAHRGITQALYITILSPQSRPPSDAGTSHRRAG